MDAVIAGLFEIAQPLRLLMLACGALAGIVIGVIPGIGGVFGMALLIPLTYHLDPYAAFALLLGMGSVTATSDTIPAVLLGVPGTVGAAATVLDGHAMARKGEAARAFGAAYSASLIGGVFGALVLAASIPIMRPLVLLMTTPDLFAISAFGLSIVALLAGSQPLKGLAAALIGILVSFIGVDDHAAFGRWTFGEVYLWSGLPLVVVFLGLFGLPELAALLARGSIEGKGEGKGEGERTVPSLAGMGQGVRDTLRELPLVLRCSWIGALLGAVPGIGASVLDWIAYGHAARRPGDGPPFGEGNVRGVIAPESANNAKEGGSLIPTIAFGVPGSASMSILLGAFLVQGLVPGPDMLGKNASITVAMVFSIALANILGAAVCLLLTRPLARVARIRAGIIVPVVLAVIVVGSFQASTSVLDLVVLFAIGFLGMAMKELNWPRAAFALGFVLGPILERYFFLAYQISGWSWLARPLVVAILAVAVLGVARRLVVWYRARGSAALPPALPDTLMAMTVAVVALAAFVSAFAFPFAAGIFPLMTSGLLTVAALGVALPAGLRLRRGGDHAALAQADARPGAYAAVLGLVLVLAIAVLALGHLAGVFLFVAVVLVTTRALSWPYALAVAAGTTLVIAGVFDGLASQPWPRPWLSALTGLALR